MTAPVISLDTFREERIAASRPRRSIGECTVRDGLVCVQLPARMTPEQTRAWCAHLLMLADSAEREGRENG